MIHRHSLIRRNALLRLLLCLFALAAPSVAFAQSDVGPYQQELRQALERRAVLEKTIRTLEQAPDFPKESLDEVRRRLRDLDRMIEPLKEIVEKTAAGDANEPTSPPPAD